jgi:hypothetical protein
LAEWVEDRKNTIIELRNLAGKIKLHAKNAKVASAFGGGISIVAGIGAAVCYFLTPITLGASVVPGIVLTGITIAGGVTSVGSSVTNYFIEKGYLGSVQEALNKDRESFNSFKKAVKKAKAVTVGEGAVYAFKVGKGIPGYINFAVSIARKLRVSEKAAASLLKLGRTARFAGHAVAFIALPLDIIFFVKDVIDLTKGNISKAAENVHKLADNLEKELNEILADS